MNDIVKAAVGELGVVELGKNKTKYHTWYDSFNPQGYSYQGEPWCAIFVCFVLALAGKKLPTFQGKKGTYPGAAAVRYLRKGMESLGWEVPAKDAQPGDVVFFTWSHVGIVERVREHAVETIEGNTNNGQGGENDGVYRRVRPAKSCAAFFRVPLSAGGR